ncbi:putative trichohyalin-like [Apostichopus japonicus]|uniref:Putative trichohyalin-like n=1 Tax=Stichopus japonicus TaxID=307972 RepID=A0A2G8L185_STIJA|nr:putative trichohyalin-like [Apostichopus japonicus]
MTSNDQIEAIQSNQSAAPPVATKPDAPDWLKDVKMEEWAKLMDETEQMKVKVRDLEDEIEAKDEQLGNLQQEKVDLTLKARVAEDALCYKEKLQERELDLKEKEKQITRLKGEMKKKDAESTPLKLQLESLKEKQIKLLQENGDLFQLKEKEREVEELGERLKHLPDGEMKKEGDENWKSEKEYLQEQNGRLMKQVDQLEPLKERMMNLQSQLEIGLSTQEDKGSLIKKLEQAEKLIEEKTAEELRLLEDNHCLQKRIDKLEREKNFQDGLEVEYENMKEQFNDLESKKHEAELSVAPLKVKMEILHKYVTISLLRTWALSFVAC